MLSWKTLPDTNTDTDTDTTKLKAIFHQADEKSWIGNSTFFQSVWMSDARLVTRPSLRQSRIPSFFYQRRSKMLAPQIQIQIGLFVTDIQSGSRLSTKVNSVPSTLTRDIRPFWWPLPWKWSPCRQLGKSASVPRPSLPWPLGAPLGQMYLKQNCGNIQTGYNYQWKNEKHLQPSRPWRRWLLRI